LRWKPGGREIAKATATAKEGAGSSTASATADFGRNDTSFLKIKITRREISLLEKTGK
jgi:hypothetical protein